MIQIVTRMVSGQYRHQDGRIVTRMVRIVTRMVRIVNRMVRMVNRMVSIVNRMVRIVINNSPNITEYILNLCFYFRNLYFSIWVWDKCRQLSAGKNIPGTYFQNLFKNQNVSADIFLSFQTGDS